MTGTETYTTSYVYDQANRLTTETKTQSGVSTVTLYVYDANGNLLSEVCNQSVLGFQYNARNQLTSAAVNGVTTGVYTYNADGIRTAKLTIEGVTYFLLDGGYVVGETTASTVKATYLYGANLIRQNEGTDETYYLYNAHGDVVSLADSTEVSTKSYKYDAFGNEDDPDEDDPNPFRYCAEYFDKETGTYYLRARYYDPTTGRFTQQDTHWNTANSIYGDNPQKINEREDKLGLKYYSYTPQISSIMQSGNLYVYCLGAPVVYHDRNGRAAELILQEILEYIWELLQQITIDPVLFFEAALGLLVIVAIVCIFETIYNKLAAPNDTTEQATTVSEAKSISQEELDELDEESETQEKVSRVGKQKGKAPRDNQKQNKQVEDVAKRLGLSKDQTLELHKAVHNQGLSYNEILDLAYNLFNIQ